MAKITKVIIKDRNTLVLNEDATIGDEIDLFAINQVDTSILVEKIKNAQDKEYQKFLKEELEKVKTKQELETTLIKGKLEQQIIELQNKLESISKDITNELTIKHQIESNKLENQIILLQQQLHSLGENNNVVIANEVINKTRQLEEEISRLKALNQKAETEKQNALLTLEKELNQALQLKEDLINKYKEEINSLKHERSSANVKRQGENLEHWCDNEYLEHAQVGFEYCTWEKDNNSIKDDDEQKGSKADYIFKVFASFPFDEINLLTSVVCEMKTEDPASKNRQKNSKHFAKLDADRRKKGCEYALLVSELEWDQDNDVPIRKVNEYDKMYIVRPQYMISFLTIIYLLSRKYQNLLLEHNKEELQFKTSQDIIDEFDKMRNDLIDKPLKTLEKELKNIIDEANGITKSAQKILDSTVKITSSTLETIKRRIEEFKITKITKKIDKLQ